MSAPRTDDPIIEPGVSSADAWERTERALHGAVERIIDQGLGTGAQVALRTGDGRRYGLALGRTRDGADLTPAIRFPLVSHTKTITATLLLELLEDEGMGVDTPVAEIVPGFAAGGKEGVTIRHLLTHTGGITEGRETLQQVGIPFVERFQHICRLSMYPDWNPETDAAYSLRVAFETLGYLVEYLGGRSFADQFDDTLGRHVGTAGFLVDFRGEPRADAVAAAPWSVFTQMPTTEAEADVPSRGFSEEALTALVLSGSPAAGAVGSAEDVCALWWNLGRAAAGDEGLGVRPSVARTMTTTRRGRRHDRVLGFECDYGLGVMIDLDAYRDWGFPADLTERTFGHIGLTHVFAGFAPEWDAAFAVVLNGRTVKSAEFSGLRTLFTALTTFFAEPT
jgi:CubicO group peptidase (beta-lactamase class C family)